MLNPIKVEADDLLRISTICQQVSKNWQQWKQDGSAIECFHCRAIQENPEEEAHNPDCPKVDSDYMLWALRETFDSIDTKPHEIQYLSFEELSDMVDESVALTKRVRGEE